MRHGLTALLFVCGGCGDVSENKPKPDAPRMIDAATPDVPIDVATNMACDLAKPFATPVNVAELNTTAGDYELWYSADRLTAYFSSVRAGGVGANDIYYATRTDTSSAFATPQLLPVVNTTEGEGIPVLSADGLTLYFGSNRTGGQGSNDIYIATRSSTAAAFGTPTALLNVNSTGNDAPTDISPDGTILYMSSTRSGDWEILRATRASTAAPFSAPTPIGELNIAAIEDYGPVVTADGLTAYFESARTGSLGCYDVYVAKRTTINDGFGTPTRVDELSTASCEWPTWVSPDGCQIAITSDRTGTLGNRDVWLATRPK